MTTSEALLDLCVDACEACAEECERALNTDPTYASGVSKFTGEQIALITCADVCRITAAAVRRRQVGYQEICTWCAEVCETCVSRGRSAIDAGQLLYRCGECATRCRAVQRIGKVE
jgi:hypothetical protein